VQFKRIAALRTMGDPNRGLEQVQEPDDPIHLSA
jgi:hypothetical protein